MDFKLIHIGADNLFRGDFNAITFSLFGLTLVFSGLIIISLFILILPKLVNSSQKSGNKGDAASPDPSLDSLTEKELLLAIATAFHLDQDFPEENEKITWKSHGDIATPWQISGRDHGLSVRSHIRRHR
jgi:hypothetical protein